MAMMHIPSISMPCDVPNSVMKFYLQFANICQLADKKLTATVFLLMLREVDAWAILPS